MKEVLNCIFLLDKLPPQKVILLKRDANKKFAPNLYTGIGGHLEENETIDESAYREMMEETGIKVELSQFATVITDVGVEMHYYWGIFNEDCPECNEGDLEWVNANQVLEKDIIPTTYPVLKEWVKREFSKEPFIVYEKTLGKDERGLLKIEVERIEDLDISTKDNSN